MTQERVVRLETVRRRAGGRDSEPPPEDDAPSGGCPVTALGHADGTFFFLGFAGEIRRLSARALGSRSELLGLFVGNTDWLEKEFPQKKAIAKVVGGETTYETVEQGFSAANACAWLMRQCYDAGIYGAHVETRRMGIWRGEDGRPVVHAGSHILVNGSWIKAGQRIGDTVWVVDARQPRPASPCDRDVGHDLLRELQRLWSFRAHGGAVITLGLIGVGYYGAAARWRSSGYFVAPAGAGKTMLHDIVAACLPMNHRTNDTSAAGVQSAVNGHAMPVLIDEAAARDDQAGIRRLMDVVLASTGGDGVRGYRGTADGGFRSISMAANFFYFSTETPALGDAHLGRITVVELERPKPGADHLVEMQALAQDMKAKGPGLWARALARFDYWQHAIERFRDGLKRAGCGPREMDQMASILASYHVLTEDGPPTDLQIRAAIAAVPDFIRTAEDVREDDSTRRAVEFLMVQQIQYDGTTRRDTVGALLNRAWECDNDTNDPRHSDAKAAIDCLLRHGIRPVRHWEQATPQGRNVPRAGDGDGLWLLPIAVDAFFKNSPWEPGRKWLRDLAQLPGTKGPVKYVVRFTGEATGRAVWLSRRDLNREEPIPFADMVTRVGMTAAQFCALIERFGDTFPRAREGVRYEDWTFDATRVTAFVDRYRADGSG